MIYQEEPITPEIQKHKNSKKVIIIALLAFIALILFYLILNFWAISSINPIIDIDEVFSTISGSNLDFSGNEVIVSGTMRVENPTFVPVVLTKLYYEVYYGETNIANAKTGYFSIAPYSEKELPIKLRISKSKVLEAGGNLIWDSILGDEKSKYIYVYADFNIKKFKIETFEK